MTERILNDRYALETKVGEGGMAVTYRARDLLLNRTVAVKLMREQYTNDPQFVERFRREAQAAARLSHENIAGVYDTGRANGTYYIVMEFVEGTDLKQRLRREGALPVLTVLEIGRQIAAALDAAHRGGLVHRDIKPHNILLNQDGKVKVTDFGIAKIASEGEDTGVIIGSVHYVSPEHARGEATTPSSDIYSLGSVLFEALTGRTVFEAPNAMAVAHKQIYERPPLPRTLRPSLPPAVESMVLKCLEKDPHARYHSAAEVQAVIQQLIAQLSQEDTIVITPSAPSMDATMVFRPPTGVPSAPLPRPSQPAYQAPAQPEGGNGWVIALVVIFLAIAAGFGVYWLLKPPAPIDPVNSVVVFVPDLIGKTEDDAMRDLQGRKLVPVKKIGFNEQIAKDLIFTQEPAPNTRVQEGDTVTFYVSQGSATFLMPDVAGMDMVEAKKAIRAAAGTENIKFTISSESSADVPVGKVIRSTPEANALVERNGAVALVMSKPEVVHETYNGTIPSMGGAEIVFYRVEIVRPGKEPDLMGEGQGVPSETIQESFTRNASEQVTIRMFVSGNESVPDPNDSVPDPIEEKIFGPGPDPTP